MSLSSIFNISGSAMSAESIRLNLTASNLANAESAGKTEDSAYHAKRSLFAASGNFQAMLDGFSNDTDDLGVKVTGIVNDNRAIDMRYEPNHPLANDKGYVFYPNVNPLEEMADMITASRAYQSNVEVINATKQMLYSALKLGEIG